MNPTPEQAFLPEHQGRRTTLQGAATVNARLFIGQGQLAPEIVAYEAPSVPNNSTMRSLWKARNGGRPTPVIVVALHGTDQASICGATGDEPPVLTDLKRGQVERLCQAILECGDRNKALSLYGRTIESLRDSMPGLRNEGLLSKYELVNRTPNRKDWSSANSKGGVVLGKKGNDILEALGFSVTRCDNHTGFLHGHNKKLALAVLLEEYETPDTQSLRFAGLSPVSYAMAKADSERLPYVVTVSGGSVRLYCTSLNAGVGRRGRTETFLEGNTDLIPDDKAALLWLLFSADALQPDGSLKEVMAESVHYAGTLAENLRERIYGKVVPNLAQAVVEARGLKRPKAEDLQQTYEISLIILFRLLFIAYAEDKDLLPTRYNGLYQKRSLKTKAVELLEMSRKGTGFDEGTTLWTEIQSLFSAIDQGNRSWSVPHYNGGLFSSDPSVSKSGEIISKLTIPDQVFGPILSDLLLIEQDGDELGPVDFASLGVREFGTVYEGLLESELSVAETNLALNRDQSYVPAGPRSEAAVKKGEVYLHNNSGARKATGSYFTKDFAVQYLIDRALSPALDKHLQHIDKLNDVDASKAFFDFKVTDISMGSGHFLTGAIDKIEAVMSGYLAKRPLPGVTNELDTLRKSAREALGEIADQLDPIEDNKLLRRLIARRCIYGVDLNPLAVQLARLAVWIHTFVPGLPLSLLDRNLVKGNSLIGIGTVDEIQKRFEQADMDLFRVDAKALLADATEPLVRLAQISDATYADIERARKAIREAQKAVEPAKALCDIITALPLASITPDDARVTRGMTRAEQTAAATKARRWEEANEPFRAFQFGEWEKIKQSIVGSPVHKRAIELLENTDARHFPISFPEVFLRDRAGFDCVLGNPPWEEITIEEKGFWTRYFPGLKGIRQREYEVQCESLRKERGDLFRIFEKEMQEAKTLRQILATGVHSMGTGDPDLYKAFVWRFWDLTRSQSGEVGVVLPRSALSAKGSEGFRKGLFDQQAGIDCCVLVNTAEWVFDGVDPRYTISLTNFTKSEDRADEILLRGPFANKETFDKEHGDPDSVTSEQVLSWNDSASLPLLPDQDSLGVFLQLRKSPRITSDVPKEWKFAPSTDLHATADKPLMDLESDKCPKGFWAVFKGESFDIWTSDTGTYYAWAKPETIIDKLQDKRLRTFERESSPFYGISRKEAQDIKTLPCYRARIAFRDVTNRTNTRTFVTALVPPKCFLANQGPYFVRVRGDESDEAYLLGVLSSLSLDWYARRFIELHANFYLVEPLPVPRPEKTSILRKRVIELAGRLACQDNRFKEWAEAVGVECGPVDPAVKEEMVHELDALVAHLYGLNKKQLTHIFETFHVGWDYIPRLKATLTHFDRWKQ
jgi:hypothetical protein